jgi:hypothetical protein
LKKNKERKRKRTEGWKGGKKNMGHRNQAHLEGSLMPTQASDVFWDTLETVAKGTVGGLNNAVSHVHTVLEQREDLEWWAEEGGGIECLRKFYDEL